MREKILKSLKDGADAVLQLQEPEKVAFIEEGAALMADVFRAGNKILIAGNGGSLCDAVHFAEELTAQFRTARPALPAIALADPGHLTCVSNDFGFEHVFSRGVEAYGKEGDLFAGMTTSGNSPNIIRAFEEAQKRGLKTMAFLGRGGGKLKGVADCELIIDGFPTADRIQEAHMLAIHILIEMTELHLFSNSVTNAVDRLVAQS